MDDLLHTLRRATEFLTLQRQVQLHSGQDAARYALDRVIAKSPVTRSFLAQVQELIKNDRVTVLLQGETGTGKQYMGRVIHYNSPRACLLYTSDAADERSSVDLGGRRIIKKKKT